MSGGGGNITCEFEVVEDHRNSHGTLHGGLMSLLVDAVTSWALHTKVRDRNSASMDLSLRYNNDHHFFKGTRWSTRHPSIQPQKTSKTSIYCIIKYCLNQIKGVNFDQRQYVKRTVFLFIRFFIHSSSFSED